MEREHLRVIRLQDSSFLSFNHQNGHAPGVKHTNEDNKAGLANEEASESETEVFEVADLTAAFAF